MSPRLLPYLIPSVPPSMESMLYYNYTKKVIPVTRAEFVARYPSINNYASRWNYDYSHNAELLLIDHLIAMGRSPYEIGVSKLCCLSCYDWVEKVNSMGREKKWIVRSTHGK